MLVVLWCSLGLCLSVGEFGSERLVQQIVDSIMKATEKSLEQVAGHHPPTPDSDDSTHPFNKEEGEDTFGWLRFSLVTEPFTTDVVIPAVLPTATH